MSKLRTLLYNRKHKWVTHVPDIVEAYNNTPHSATAFNPNYLLNGKQDLPFFVTETRGNLEEDRSLALERTKFAMCKRADQFDAKHKNVKFNVDDLVIKKLPMNHPTRHKLAVRNEGPFKVVKKINDWSYELQRLGETKKIQRAHISQLLPFFTRDALPSSGGE